MSCKVRLLSSGSIAVLVALGGCVSAPPEVDLAPARKAVEEARARAASAEAKECLARAEQDLAGAEKLASTSGAEERSRAAVLASAAVAGAACVDRLEVQARRLGVPAGQPAAAATGGSGEPEKLRARLRRAAEDQRRLEEMVAVLQADLETTENELIRTKAKLKGIETKAEASSAIAEAQTLVLRSGEDKVRPTNAARAREKLGLAESQLRAGNYGAAVFFALQAQDLLEKSGRTRATSPPESPPAGAVVVKASSANVRSEPRRDAPVIARLPRGTSVVPLAEEGKWTRVEVEGRTGWIANSLIR
jgi:Bacterial SH3 domain